MHDDRNGVADFATPENLCAMNACGHVDTEAVSQEEHGHMNPHDFAAMLDAWMHGIGVVSVGNCYACYSEREADRLVTA